MGYDEGPWVFKGRCAACSGRPPPHNACDPPSALDPLTRLFEGCECCHLAERCSSCSWSRLRRCAGPLLGNLIPGLCIFVSVLRADMAWASVRSLAQARKYVPESLKLVSLFGCGPLLGAVCIPASCKVHWRGCHHVQQQRRRGVPAGTRWAAFSSRGTLTARLGRSTR